MSKTMVSLWEMMLVWGRRGAGLLFVILVVGGCQRSGTQVTQTDGVEESRAPIPTETAVVDDEATMVLEPTADLELTAVKEAPATASALESDDASQELLIIYTNDEHGWMEGVEAGRGAAEMVSVWREMGCGADNCLIVSGGDMWTGPAVSTWADGESMVEVMNAMGYAAAAVGNHEFDFGLEQLQANAGLSEFPFVSANIRRSSDGGVPTEWGIEPFTLVERAGVTIGIVGLSTQRTPQTTLPTNVADFEFIEYAEALAEVVPQARAAGAQLIVVPGHLCLNEVTSFLTDPLFTDLLVTVLGGGHCNELFATVEDEQAVLIGGSQLQSFASARLTVRADGKVTDIETAIHENVGGETDVEIDAIVAKWRAASDAELGRVIGYLDAPLTRRGQAMQDLITYSWLESVPSADIAVTNLGGMRAEFAAGELTVGDVVTVLPFNNVLVEVVLTGEEFKQIFGLRPDMAIGGASWGIQGWEMDDGSRLEDETSYVVLVSDFMYAGGDELGGIAAADPQGYNTAINWRQPVIDWVEGVESSAEKPLNGLIDELVESKEASGGIPYIEDVEFEVSAETHPIALRKLVQYKDGEPSFVLAVADQNLKNQVALTNRSLSIDDPQWSPDGLDIAFSARSDESDDWDIYLFSFEDSKISQLTSTDDTNEVDPTWSPSGDAVAYLASEKTTVFRTNVDAASSPYSGPAIGIANVENNAMDGYIFVTSFAAPPLYWEASGKISTARNFTTRGIFRFKRFAVSLLEKGFPPPLSEQVIRLDNRIWSYAVSPDEKAISFLQSSINLEPKLQLYLYDDDLSESRRIVEITEFGPRIIQSWHPLFDNTDMAWAADGKSVLVTGEVFEQFSVVQVDIETGDVVGLSAESIDRVDWYYPRESAQN